MCREVKIVLKKCDRFFPLPKSLLLLFRSIFFTPPMEACEKKFYGHMA